MRSGARRVRRAAIREARGREARGRRAGRRRRDGRQGPCRSPMQGLPWPRWRQRGTGRAAPRRAGRALPARGAEGLQGGQALARRAESHRRAHERSGDTQRLGVLRQPSRRRAGAGQGCLARFALRTGQGARGGLRQVPWRGRQRDRARHPEPGRAAGTLPDRRAAGICARRTQVLADARGDAHAVARGHGGGGDLLRLARAAPSAARRPPAIPRRARRSAPSAAAAMACMGSVPIR